MLSEERIEGTDFLSEPRRQARQVASDTAVTDDEQSFAGYVGGLKPVSPLPLTSAHRTISADQAFRAGEY